ncbi:pimeloyl-ACP methyl esterase BioG family protein [Ruegeria sp. EL01]|jgi:biotin synthesis protein BioG|uniref:pimeloyl-ACP methyl esterase BioG family protein n=1 Tax=Ruegeria sp. EL01 TaxID=2107578 RepID=UPI000EA835A5|nr:pimeloyl-ACP methyl esterase BioG family protein [Ruegeria sp. EL01]
MKRQWLTRSGTAELTLVFGGWALGAAPFADLTGDKDLLLVDDYTHLDDPLSELALYDRFDLIAFSFGVASAGHWMSMAGFLPAHLTAVSGTLSPADAEKGIAPDIIRRTADKLCDSSFAKFCRRAGLQTPAPTIDINVARAELHAVINRGPAPEHRFDRIWIPKQDWIIPTRAQEAAWKQQRQAIRHIPGSHIPFRAGQSWAEWVA